MVQCVVQPKEQLTEYLRTRQPLELRTDTNDMELHDFAELAIRMCPKNDKPAKIIHIYTDGSSNEGRGS